MRSTLRASLVVVVLVLLTVGCGGGSGGTGSSSQGSGAKPLKQWAAQFCTGTVAWVNSLKGASSAVTTQTAASAGDVTALMDMLIKLLNDSMTATTISSGNSRPAARRICPTVRRSRPAS